MAPLDRFLEDYRVAIVGGTIAVVILGAPALYFLRFDFNPIHLRSSKVESIATYLDLRRDPDTGANAINVMVKSEQEAQRVEIPARRSA